MSNVDEVSLPALDKENNGPMLVKNDSKTTKAPFVASNGTIEEGDDSKLMERKKKMQPRSVQGFSITLMECPPA